MANSLPDMKELKAIVDWVNLAEDVRELSLKLGDVELFVSRNRAGGVAQGAPLAAEPSVPMKEPKPTPAAPIVVPAPAVGEQEAAHDADQLTQDEVLITAPMLGTFYASPQPGAPAFVSVGDRVQPSSVLAIVEVMKLMNNIEAGVEGTVVRVLAENESLVEYGQPLIVIRKGAS
ncbi:acetyl-CoA carboxylase, biotin carboxyl carrier protein [Arthrobacter sp. NtRootA1]|nr:acetyl-CoA carboxylase, biotin carboxyl carrier protein [Arthrobacter sp. NtRootA1]